MALPVLSNPSLSDVNQVTRMACYGDMMADPVLAESQRMIDQAFAEQRERKPQTKLGVELKLISG